MVRKGMTMKQYIDRNGDLWNGCYIVVNGQTIVNPTESMLLSNGYTEVKEPEKTQNELFEERKQTKIKQIEDYDNSNNVNVFYIYQQPMWLDFDERSRILTSINAYRKMQRTEMTKIYNNVEFTFPIETWEELLSAVEIYASECLNVTQRHKMQVYYAINDEELNAIDITSGYPEKLIFNPNDDEEGGE